MNRSEIYTGTFIDGLVAMVSSHAIFSRDVTAFMKRYPKSKRLRFKECPDCHIVWHVAFNMATGEDSPDVVTIEEQCDRCKK